MKSNEPESDEIVSVGDFVVSTPQTPRELQILAGLNMAFSLMSRGQIVKFLTRWKRQNELINTGKIDPAAAVARVLAQKGAGACA